MTESTPPGRPVSNTLVQLDLTNAYARLGVSPLATTEEIKRVADEKRRELMRQRRTRGQQQFGAEEAEMTALQEIEERIGSPKARAAYDRANPQNELLTVQPAPHDRWLDPRHRAGLITAWLVDELGRDALLPSPEAAALWAPHGVSPELARFLRAFVRAGEPVAADTPEAAPTADSMFPGVAELDRAAPDTTAKEEPDRA